MLLSLCLSVCLFVYRLKRVGHEETANEPVPIMFIPHENSPLA